MRSCHIQRSVVARCPPRIRRTHAHAPCSCCPASRAPAFDDTGQWRHERWRAGRRRAPDGVGQLVFYVPDALPSPYGADQPGGWFSCSGTLLSGTVVVTAGHCTFAIGRDSVSTTTAENRFTAENGNGTGGNDVWFSLNEDDDHWNGWPLTFDEEGNLNFPSQQARYEARRDFLNGNPLWVRAT